MKISLFDAYDRLDLATGTDMKAVRKRCSEMCGAYKTDKSKLKEVCSAYKRITEPGAGDMISLSQVEVRQIIDILQNIDRQIIDGSKGNGSTKDTNQILSNGQAREFISDDPKKRNQSEKRKAKKKKRKEKKKTEKEESGVEESEDSDSSVHGSSGDEETLDPNAAFIRNTKKKVIDSPILKPGKNKNADTTKEKDKNQTATNHDPQTVATEHLNGRSIKSQRLAIQGNRMAHDADFPQAIKLFSEAIKLEPSDYRFYGNRSFCFDKTMKYKEGLQDADKCIKLAPEWPKGYFRKGRALSGLLRYSEAEEAFQKVLKLDRNCEEATKELWRVRTRYLLDLGFSQTQSEAAAAKHSSLRQAVDSLLASNVGSSAGINDAIYHSDDESSSSRPPRSNRSGHNAAKPAAARSTTSATSNSNEFTTPGSHRKSTRPSDVLTETKKMDPANPEGLSALWVGNVLPTVTDDQLQKLFSKYGHISSVRCLPEKFCAFVNFYSKAAAGKAMNALQSHPVDGQRLLIKFPDNPSSSLLSRPKTTPYSDAPRHNQLSSDRVTGPVNGNECYFWRTTGCQFGARCRWSHVAENEGVDRKTW